MCEKQDWNYPRKFVQSVTDAPRVYILAQKPESHRVHILVGKQKAADKVEEMYQTSSMRTFGIIPVCIYFPVDMLCLLRFVEVVVFSKRWSVTRLLCLDLCRFSRNDLMQSFASNGESRALFRFALSLEFYKVLNNVLSKHGDVTVWQHIYDKALSYLESG